MSLSDIRLLHRGCLRTSAAKGKRRKTMQLETGKYVIYRSSEICRIEGFETKSFDGVTEKEYCVLVPDSSERSRYYVPMDRAESKLRPLLTKEEILSLIDGMRAEQPDWGAADERRKERFAEVLSGGDYKLIISMMHTLYIEKQQRTAQGKKLLAVDEKAMKAAESLIYHEFGFVLGIKENEVAEFIAHRLEGNK